MRRSHDVFDAITLSFDPVHQYLDGLKWDGTHRVYAWTTTYLGTPDTVFARAAGKAWLIQCVERTYKPGCQADHALVLEGDQGTKKTSALKILGGRWFTDSIGDTGNKDTYVNLLGKWIVELAELDSMKRAEATAFKTFISNRDDYFREPYAKLSSSHPRRCVFAGSTNEDGYLQDPTGARRFWPIPVLNVDADALTRDRDQIWAEAVVMMKAGAVGYLDQETQQMAAKEEQEQRHSADAWESLIGQYIEDHASTSITVQALLQLALKISAGKWTRGDQMRVASCLKRLGWVKQRASVDGKRSWHYVRRPTAPTVPVVPPLPPRLLMFRDLFRGEPAWDPANTYDEDEDYGEVVEDRDASAARTGTDT